MSRTPEEIFKLFAYNRWANEKALEPVSTLTAEEFGRTLGGSFSSLRDTLAHIYGAEWIWLERWQGRSPKGLPPADEVPTLEVLREKWDDVEKRRRVFLQRLTAARLGEPLTYINMKGETWTYPLGELLVHLTNHSTYHRGQVATLLRQLGKAPKSTDYLDFLDAK